MFDSDLLDRLSRVHFSVPLVIFLPAIGVLLASGARVGSAPEFAALIVSGYLFWTLTEYWLHRLVFHWQPKFPGGDRLHFIIHGVHHDHPNDAMRLVMPPAVSIPLAALFLGLYVLSLLARPFTRYRLVLLLAMIGAFVGALAIPPISDFCTSS